MPNSFRLPLVKAGHNVSLIVAHSVLRDLVLAPLRGALPLYMVSTEYGQHRVISRRISILQAPLVPKLQKQVVQVVTKRASFHLGRVNPTVVCSVLVELLEMRQAIFVIGVSR